MSTTRYWDPNEWFLLTAVFSTMIGTVFGLSLIIATLSKFGLRHSFARKTSRTRPVNAKMDGAKVGVRTMTLVSIILFAGHSITLFTYLILVWGFGHEDNHTYFIMITATWMWTLGKSCMFILYTVRLFITFQSSMVYRFRDGFFTFVLLAIILSILVRICWNIPYIGTNKHVFWALGAYLAFSDIFITVVIIYNFNSRLFKMLLSQATRQTREFSSTLSHTPTLSALKTPNLAGSPHLTSQSAKMHWSDINFTMNQLRLLDTTTKLGLLSSVAVLSTSLCNITFVYVVFGSDYTDKYGSIDDWSEDSKNAIWTVNMVSWILDPMINSVCLLLVSRLWKREYSFLCGCCHHLCQKWCIIMAKRTVAQRTANALRQSLLGDAMSRDTQRYYIFNSATHNLPDIDEETSATKYGKKSTATKLSISASRTHNHAIHRHTRESEMSDLSLRQTPSQTHTHTHTKYTPSSNTTQNGLGLPPLPPAMASGSVSHSDKLKISLTPDFQHNVERVLLVTGDSLHLISDTQSK